MLKLGFWAVLVMTALQTKPVKKAWVLANSLAAARIDKGKKKKQKTAQTNQTHLGERLADQSVLTSVTKQAS